MSGWRTKRFDSAEEVCGFVNEPEPDGYPVGDFRLSAVGSSHAPSFRVFYKREVSDRRFGEWRWAKGPLRMIMTFLNRPAPFGPADAEMCAAGTSDAETAFVFFTAEVPAAGVSGWRTERFDSVEEVRSFINGLGSYGYPVGDVRLSVLGSPHSTSFRVFYKREVSDRRFGDWRWGEGPLRKVMSFLNRPAPTGPADAEVCAAGSGDAETALVFYTTDVSAGNGIPDVGTWLGAHQEVGEALVWEMPYAASELSPRSEYSPLAYRDWPPSQKRDLQEAFEGAWQGRPSGLPEVAPNMIEITHETPYIVTVLAKADAWPLYLSHVAQSLVAELDRRVGWSILEYDGQVLANLLDGRQFLRWSAEDEGYKVIGAGSEALGPCVPAPADLIHDFLVQNEIFAEDKFSTLARMLEWCRANLCHCSVTGTDTAGEMMNEIWQYGGWPPIARILSGTVSANDPTGQVKHWTFGCHGTSAFLRNVLRVVNIPVRAVYPCHCSPHFISEARYLSHGDDLYNKLVKSEPPFAAEEILIDQSTYDEWFDPNLSIEDRCRNVGRRPKELAVQYLPHCLLQLHCDDLDAGAGQDEGEVFHLLGDVFTLEELEALNLWQRMDEKIGDLGGCESLPGVR